MNRNSKAKLQKVMAKRKMRGLKQYGVVTMGGGINPAEFVDLSAKVVKVQGGAILLFQ